MRQPSSYHTVDVSGFMSEEIYSIFSEIWLLIINYE